jgi:hypothetical protein
MGRPALVGLGEAPATPATQNNPTHCRPAEIGAHQWAECQRRQLVGASLLAGHCFLALAAGQVRARLRVCVCLFVGRCPYLGARRTSPMTTSPMGRTPHATNEAHHERAPRWGPGTSFVAAARPAFEAPLEMMWERTK